MRFFRAVASIYSLSLSFLKFEIHMCDILFSINSLDINSIDIRKKRKFVSDCVFNTCKTKSLDNFQITLTHNSLLAGDVFSFIKYFNLLYRISRILYIT